MGIEGSWQEVNWIIFRLQRALKMPPTWQSVNHASFLPFPLTSSSTETDLVNTQWKLSLSGSKENLNFFPKSVVLLQCGPQASSTVAPGNLVEAPRIMWELRHFLPQNVCEWGSTITFRWFWCMAEGMSYRLGNMGVGKETKGEYNPAFPTEALSRSAIPQKLIFIAKTMHNSTAIVYVNWLIDSCFFSTLFHRICRLLDTNNTKELI